MFSVIIDMVIFKSTILSFFSCLSHVSPPPSSPTFSSFFQVICNYVILSFWFYLVVCLSSCIRLYTTLYTLIYHNLAFSNVIPLHVEYMYHTLVYFHFFSLSLSAIVSQIYIYICYKSHDTSVFVCAVNNYLLMKFF